MKVVSLQSGGLQNGVPVFGVQVEADAGARFSFWVDGKTLHHPVAFADHAAERTGQPCSSEFVGNEGGWHSHLGDMLRRSGGLAQPATNAVAVPVAADADRRAALLSATPLGKATAAAELAAANFVAPAAPAPEPVSFAEQCRLDAEKADRDRRAHFSRLLKLTPLGRDVLAHDAKCADKTA